MFRSSVRLSVRPSVRNSVPIIDKVQYLKFGWSCSNLTWTVSSSKGCSHFTDITCPWGVGRGQNVGLFFFVGDFCHSLTLLPPGASVFHKHMSSSVYEHLCCFGHLCPTNMFCLLRYSVHHAPLSICPSLCQKHMAI